MWPWYSTFLFHNQERGNSKRSQHHGQSSGKDGAGDTDIAGMLSNFSKALGEYQLATTYLPSTIPPSLPPSLPSPLKTSNPEKFLFTFMAVRKMLYFPWGWSRCVNFLDLVSFWFCGDPGSQLVISKLGSNKSTTFLSYLWNWNFCLIVRPFSVWC